MKRLELSESVSNLLLLSSVLLAFTPFVLGDRLLFIVSGAMRESAIMIDQFGAYLTFLLS